MNGAITNGIVIGLVVTVFGGLFLWALQRIITGFDKTLDHHRELIGGLFDSVKELGREFSELLGEHKRNHK
jgi:hypothetical protein